MNGIDHFIAKGVTLIVSWVFIQVSAFGGLIEEALKDSLLFGVMIIALYIAYKELKRKDDKIEGFTERLIKADERQTEALKDLTKSIMDLNKKSEKVADEIKEEINNKK